MTLLIKHVPNPPSEPRRIGPTLLGTRVRLFTNYPITGDFHRREKQTHIFGYFKMLKWPRVWRRHFIFKWMDHDKLKWSLLFLLRGCYIVKRGNFQNCFLCLNSMYGAKRLSKLYKLFHKLFSFSIGRPFTS